MNAWRCGRAGARPLLILAAVTGLAVGFAVMVSQRSAPTTAVRQAEPTPLFDGLRARASEISRIRVARAGQETILERVTRDGKATWVVRSRDGYPARLDRVRSVVEALVEARVIETRTSNPEFYERLGVAAADAPGSTSLRVTTYDGAGVALSDVIVGNPRETPGAASMQERPTPEFFVRRPEAQAALLVRGELFVDADPLSFIERTVLELDQARIRGVVIERVPPGEGDTPVVISRNGQADRLELRDIPNDREPKDDFTAERIGQALSFVNVDDVRSAQGFEPGPGPAIEARFHTFDGLILTATTQADASGRRWTRFAAALNVSGTNAPNLSPPATDAPSAAEAQPAANAPVDVLADEPKPAPVPRVVIEPVTLEEVAQSAREQEVAELNARLSGWLFRLQDFKLDQVTTTREALLKPAAAPVAPGPVAPGAPAVPVPALPASGTP